MKKIVLLAFVLFLFSTGIIVGFLSPVMAVLPIHNIDSGKNFSTIQEAINDDSTLDGDTILVDAGTYYENVVVNKSISLVGEDKNTTILSAKERGSVVRLVNVSYSRVSGLTLSTSARAKGIYVVNSKGVVLDQNIIKRTTYGIYFVNSNGGVIYNNILTVNYDYDIYLHQSNYTLVSLNSFSRSTCRSSIWLTSSVHNIVDKNTIRSGRGSSITLRNSHENMIENNWLTDKSWDGVDLAGSCNNTIIGNTIENNWRGFVLNNANDNKFYHNSLIDNKDHTVKIIRQVVMYGFNNANTWDDGLGKGNYWSDYNGQDLNNDSIGDVPYVIDEKNQDDYPLMNPYSIPPEKMQDLYYELLSSYGSLQTNYDDLNSNYEHIVNELNTIRSQMYVFMITTIVFIATTVYFALRKPKTLPSSISEV